MSAAEREYHKLVKYVVSPKKKKKKGVSKYFHFFFVCVHSEARQDGVKYSQKVSSRRFSSKQAYQLYIYSSGGIYTRLCSRGPPDLAILAATLHRASKFSDIKNSRLLR